MGIIAPFIEPMYYLSSIETPSVFIEKTMP